MPQGTGPIAQGPDQHWSWFPWGVLRSAGFPISLVALLDSSDTARAAEQFLAAERELIGAGTRLRGRAAGTPHPTERRRLERAIRSRRRADTPDTLADLAPHIEAWNAVRDKCEAAGAAFEDTYGGQRGRASDRLRQGLAVDGLRRALLWQNRKALPSLDKGRDAWDERVLLKYLTRYVTKNDTIGFFGPAAWIRLSDQAGYIDVTCGPSLVRRTHVSFEIWPIAAIAAALSQDRALMPWLAPRRAAMCRVDGGRVFMPPGCEHALPPIAVDVLRLCNGVRTAADIARTVGLDGLDTIHYLSKEGLITWALECPMQLHPEQAIRKLKDRVSGTSLEATLDDHTGWLSSVTDRLAAAMDSSIALESALAAIDAEFEARYTTPALQGDGQYYAGRTLTYIDCHRDATVTLRADALDRLMTGLAPMLMSLRWYTYTIGSTLVSAVADLLPRDRATPLASIFPQVQGLMMDIITATADAYRDKWWRVLDIDSSRREVRLDARELATAIQTEFDAPHPGWPLARLHNPDVLVAASGPDDLARGACVLVLGEVHASLPSMFQSALYSLCPDPVAVRDLCYALVPPPPVITESSQRLNLGEFYVHAEQLLLPDEPVTHPQARPIADFDVCLTDAGPAVRDVVGGRTWPVPVFFDALLSRATFHVDPFDRPGEHRPRVLVGSLVVAREAWRLRAVTVGVAERRRADAGDQARHFLSIRRWAREHDLPRHVFARSSREPKPLFIDLESQVSVALLVHLLKQAEAHDPAGGVWLTEMLPRPAECWLPDASGERYTSELRLLAVDPVPYPQSPSRPE